MGYKRGRTVYVLRFEDPEMEGLVVRCHSISIGRMMELTRLAALKFKRPEEMTDDDLGKVMLIYELFAKSLVSWNLEDDDGPVPATLEGVIAQDADFLNALIKAWMTEVAGIPDPLARSSTAGSPSVELNMPTELLSLSLPN